MFGQYNKRYKKKKTNWNSNKSRLSYMDLFSYPELLAAFVKNILDIYRRRHGKVLDLTQSVTTAPIKCKNR